MITEQELKNKAEALNLIRAASPFEIRMARDKFYDEYYFILSPGPARERVGNLLAVCREALQMLDKGAS